MNPTKIGTDEFKRMDDEISQHSRVLDQYLTDLQKSSYIKHHTNRIDHNTQVRRLVKLMAKAAKVKDRLGRLRKHRDPNYANAHIDAVLIVNAKSKSRNKKAGGSGLVTGTLSARNALLNTGSVEELSTAWH